MRKVFILLVLQKECKFKMKPKKIVKPRLKKRPSGFLGEIKETIDAGDKDQRAMFDQALESIADDVSAKMGEMERFMELSSSFMDSVDLQNGVFEEEGLKMLEKWEKEGPSLLLGNEKSTIINQANDDGEILDLDQPFARPEKAAHKNQYDSFFE